jgi:hypothetical protein
MHKHTYETYKDKIKIENIITGLFKDFKIRKHKVLQKIEQVCGSVSLYGQPHSPHPRGEDLLRKLCLRQAPVWNVALKSLDFH